MNHPCNGCPSRAYSGLVACPVLAKVINHGRCKRLRRKSAGEVRQLAELRWINAHSDKSLTSRQRRWIDFSWGYQDQLRNMLITLPPREQIHNMSPEILVARLDSALSGDSSDGRETDTSYKDQGDSGTAYPSRFRGPDLTALGIAQLLTR